MTVYLAVAAWLVFFSWFMTREAVINFYIKLYFGDNDDVTDD